MSTEVKEWFSRRRFLALGLLFGALSVQAKEMYPLLGAGACSTFLVHALDRYFPAAAHADEYPLYPMSRRFRGESPGPVRVGALVLSTRYLTPQEREETKVKIREGLLHWPDGRLVGDYGYHFVMDQHGEFYLHWPSDRSVFKHSSFFAGGPVAAAGTLWVEKGRITGVNRLSGHYQPNVWMLRRALNELRLRGVDLSGAKIWWGIREPSVLD